jgi:hypothetical protein
MMTARGPRLLLWTLLFTTASCRGGCNRGVESVRSPRGALALFPAEARIVASLDFQKIRQAAAWQQLSALVSEDAKDRKIIDELVARTGFDPFQQVHRIFAAFPEDARTDGAFGLLIEGDGFDEKRLLTYARDQARLRGEDIQQRAVGRRTFWSGTTPGGPTGFFLDARHFVLAGGGWGERMAALADGGPGISAESNAALVSLAERVGAGRSIWMAALVPETTRARLRQDPRVGAQASVMSLGVGLDLGPGLEGGLTGELGNEEDARALARKVQTFVREAKGNAQMLLLGASPYLDAIEARAEGASLRIRVALTQAQTSELLARLVGLVRLGRERR